MPEVRVTSLSVKAPRFPTGATVYMYYVRLNCQQAPMETNTFDFFDDFSGNT